jgi:hypothetical protein
MKEIFYEGAWYKEGDTIKMGRFFSRYWMVRSIHYDCSCVLERNGKTKVMIGSVRGITIPVCENKPAEFNNWMNYIHRQLK